MRRVLDAVDFHVLYVMGFLALVLGVATASGRFPRAGVLAAAGAAFLVGQGLILTRLRSTKNQRLTLWVNEAVVLVAVVLILVAAGVLG